MMAMVVDDCGITRRILVNTLRSIGFSEVLEAADGQSAVGLLVPQIDIILARCGTSGLTDLEPLRKLQWDPRWAHAPLLLITGREAGPSVIGAARAGIAGHLVQPFTRDALRAAVDELLASDEPATGTDG